MIGSERVKTFVSFGDLLVLTSVELSSNSHASRHKLFTNHLHKREMYGFEGLARTCEPTREAVWPPIVSPYASSGFTNLVDLRVRLASSLKMKMAFVRLFCLFSRLFVCLFVCLFSCTAYSTMIPRVSFV